MTKVVDLVALQSTNSASCSARMSLLPWKAEQQYCTDAVVLCTCIDQGCDSARETTCPRRVSQVFPWCGAAVSGMNPQLPHRRRVYIGTGRCSGHLGVSLFIIGIKSSDGSNVGILLKMLTFDDQDATCLKFCLSFYRYSPSPVQISTLSNTTPEESWNRLE